MYGLPNLGLSCFINSVLNSLYFIPHFARYFSSPSRSSEKGLARLLTAFVSQYGKVPIETRLLWQIREYFPQFRSGEMGSAYEFLIKILETLDEENSGYVRSTSQEPRFDGHISTWMSELDRFRASGCSELHEAFSLLIEETRTCSRCSRSSVKYVYQRTLSLDLIPETQRSQQDKGRAKQYFQPSISIESCLDSIFLEERDAPDSCHLCKQCRSDQVHVTQKSLKHIGSVLVIYLQRYHSKFANEQVSVPEQLNMGTNLGRYMLSAAIRHEGSREGGHYTCLVKTISGWMLCDDQRTQRGEPSKSYLNSSTLFVYLKAPN